MIWNPEIEQADRKTIQELQLSRLQDTVKRAYENVPFYRQTLDKAGITPDDIKSLDDLKKIPFTVKQDMRDHYPYGLLAVPMSEVVRIHASSGTTGSATVVAYTKEDLEIWSECMARLIVMSGGSKDDIAQIAFGYGLFTGALGLHYGMEKIGAAVIPISSGNTQRQVQFLKDFGSTILVSTPSYALYISDVAAQMGIDLAELPVRIALLGSEGHTEEMNAEIERRWGVIATENYGLSEVMGPGVSGECLFKEGMHINEDAFIVEIIDPETGQVLPEGSEGEVVITTINKFAQPLLRYRTRDISSVTTEPCRCGRTSMRMSKIKGRSDDMLKIRGVNVFPSQIERVLLNTKGVGPSYEVILTRKNFTDQVEVVVEIDDMSLLESYGELEALSRRIQEKMQQELLIKVKVTLANPMSLRRYEGKARRVRDLRGETE
ncbi:MAG: phenylacetate--CoA ligase [Clostridia bacterium]|nr:phenylacetate--CoA ligase [Clostridia bacterium]